MRFIHSDFVVRTLGAVAADPPWVALTGAVDGVTGAVVGAAAAPHTVLPKATTGTHCSQAGRVCSSFTIKSRRRYHQTRRPNV